MDDLDAVFGSDRGCRPAWHCSVCGAQAASWHGGIRSNRCVQCELAERQASRPPLSTSDRESKYVRGGIHAGNPAIVRETPKAILFSWPGYPSRWVPKSTIKRHDAGGLHVAPWFAEKHLLEVIA